MLIIATPTESYLLVGFGWILGLASAVFFGWWLDERRKREERRITRAGLDSLTAFIVDGRLDSCSIGFIPMEESDAPETDTR